MTRRRRILALLEGARSVPAEELVAQFGVTRRTVAAEIAALQDQLGTSAAITLDEGRYRLMVADQPRYRAVLAALEEVSFNDPQTRASYLIARLFRAHAPLRIDELAAAMAVGRTTVVTDLTRVRELLAPDELTVAGRPNVGLTLEGPELQQRLHVLRHHFPLAYPHDAQQGRIEQLAGDLASAEGIERSYVPELVRWAVVCLDRVVARRPIETLPSGYARLGETPAYELAATLADRLASEFHISLDDLERIFLTLPIAGMRAPGNPDAATRLSGALGDSDALVNEVLAAVASEMDIDLGGSGFLAEFARHLAYMLNRMRYRIWVDDTHVADVRHEFPVAYQMATVAARVVEDRVGIPVGEAELGFLATYFQVFLEGRAPSTDFLQVAVIPTTGQVGAELVRLQLVKLLPTGSEVKIWPLDQATPQALAGQDLVVVAGEHTVACDAPTVHVTRVLDRSALLRQLERLKLRIPVGAGLRRGSVLAGALDEQHFFALPAGTAYLDAVDYMTYHLEGRGLAEPGFAQRIRQREAQARMQLDPWVGFPHTTLAGTEVLLAVGVVPRAPQEDGVRLIVLLGVPSQWPRSQDVLVQVYDEVLRLGARRDLLQGLSQLTSYEQFYYFLEKNPTTKE